MSEERPIAFTDNYEDLSSNRGFQFKFNCERCGNGYMSTFVPNRLGTAGGLLGAAGSLFGGVLDRVADGARRVGETVGSRQHDGALRDAVEEIRPLFVQCRRCGTWVCREICFNPRANMCKQCAPIAEEEETAIRASHVDTQVTNDLFLEENVRMSAKGKEVAAKCKQCGQPTLGKKFCPSCGEPTAAAASFCAECGAKLTPGAKFCGECGAAMEQPVADVCPQCGKPVHGAKFCPECGAKIERQPAGICPNCGTATKGAKFCPECGTKQSG